MGQVQHVFRWVNESAYLVSVPFLICLILGLAVSNHSLMVLGATAVVLLNLGRIIAGLANLVVIPFRDSPVQGVLFLIPPLTFVYLVVQLAQGEAAGHAYRRADRDHSRSAAGVHRGALGQG